MARSVTVQSIKGMKSEALVGPHRIALDAPAEAGGASRRFSAHTEGQGRITAVEAEIIVGGPFDDSQLAKLTQAAETCRISRALNVPVTSRLTLA